MWPRICDISKKRASLSEAFLERSSKSKTKSFVISTNIGTPPAFEMDPGTGASVKVFVSTLSPGFSPAAFYAMLIAYPPEAQAKQYLLPW